MSAPLYVDQPGRIVNQLCKRLCKQRAVEIAWWSPGLGSATLIHSDSPPEGDLLETDGVRYKIGLHALSAGPTPRLRPVRINA